MSVTIPFNCAHSFYVDKNVVTGASQVCVSAIDLYFKSKPAPILNTAGIENPSVSVFIVETVFSIPQISNFNTQRVATVEYNNIVTTSDGSLPTKFSFNVPVMIDTNKEYAFLVSFDRNAEFILWKSVSGDYLAGTTTISAGPSHMNTGNYFDYIQPASTVTTANSDPDYTMNWSPVNDTTLKYNIYLARYYHSGVAVSANNDLPVDVVVREYDSMGTSIYHSNGDFIIPSRYLEFLIFDQNISTKESFVGGQIAYQNTFAYPGGYYGGRTEVRVATVQGNTVVTAQSTFTNGTSFNWSTVFPSLAEPQRIVFKDANKVNVRQVLNILSNTQIEVDEPLTFDNTAASFLITPTGKIDAFNKSSPFGVTDSIMILTNSSANSTVRFVNNTIESVAVTNGGTGYNNADILYVNGFENVSGKVTGGYRAQANLVTNSSGGITAVYFSNSGAGFVNTSLVTVTVGNSSSSNTTSNTANGSGLVPVFTVGASIKTDLRANNNFRNVKVVNLPVSEIVPFFDVQTPSGSTYDLKIQTRYTRTIENDTFSGFGYYVDTESANNVFTIKMFQRNLFEYSNIPAFMSRSNEFVTFFSNGALNTLTANSYESPVKLIINATSNNDFISFNINSVPVAQFSKFLINNDYTNEHTDYGAAWAKHISNKISLQRDAEDLRVYLTAYKPPNTDIKVYARLHNSLDTEAFDDKSWTLLEQKDGTGLVSSATSWDRNKMVELAYGLPQYGNVEFTLAGYVSASSNSDVLVGVGTTFSTNTTANLVAGDLVRIYQPLFPEDMMLSIVDAVANDTQFTITSPVTNNNLLGTSLRVDKIQYKNQGFNNIMNDNVARYYNSSLMEIDNFDTFQLKVVLLSDSPTMIPRVDDLRAIGVSA